MVNAHLLRQDAALLEVIRRLVTAYRPFRIYLFGSKARGEAGPDSDYDLLIIVEDEALTPHRDSSLAYQVLWGTHTAVDALVLTRTEFESRLHVASSLPATVVREATLLHEA
jgi:predicted nucleotidyltransferase